MTHHCKLNFLLICMLFFTLTPYLKVYLFVNKFFDSTTLKPTTNFFFYGTFILFLRRHSYCEYYYFGLFNEMTYVL
jgi:hypothetical protein